jgi:hypothetical protein
VGMWMDRDKQARPPARRHQGLFVHVKLLLEVQGPSGMQLQRQE